PTYGSTVVLTTSATSGPAGSQVSDSRGLPSTVVTGGSSCSGGDGNALVSTSSSSAMPTPRVAHTGITGWNEPRATPVSRSVTSTCGSISSPDRYRSIRDSSSLSAMTPSISALRALSISSTCSGSGSRWLGRYGLLE